MVSCESYNTVQGAAQLLEIVNCELFVIYFCSRDRAPLQNCE